MALYKPSKLKLLHDSYYPHCTMGSLKIKIYIFAYGGMNIITKGLNRHFIQNNTVGISSKFPGESSAGYQFNTQCFKIIIVNIAQGDIHHIIDRFTFGIKKHIFYISNSGICGTARNAFYSGIL